MSPRPRLLAAVLGLALSGCAHPFVCEARGGPPWREVVSPRFVLHTDLPAPEARAFAGELERVDDAVYGALSRFVLPPDVPLRAPAGRIEVVVLADRGHFETFADERVGAFISRDDAGHQRIVLPARMDGAIRAAVAHELTHRWTLKVLPDHPLWVTEGLAVFMESLGAEGGVWTRAAASIGGMPPDRFVRPPSMWELKALLTSARLDGRGYAVAWGVVHFLQNTRPAAFQDYLRRLARGERSVDAWAQALPCYDLRSPEALATLHREFDAYLHGGQYTSREVVLGAAPPIEAERPFPADRVHTLRLELPRRAARRSRRLERALLREADETLRESPGNLAALRTLARLRPTEAYALASQAVHAHADDPAAWLFLAKTERADPARRDQALSRALALAPDHAEARWHLAASLLDQQRPADALPHAEQAVRGAPGSPYARGVLGRALSSNGRCGEAAIAYADAVQLAIGFGDHALAQAIRELLHPLRSRCPEAFASEPAVGDKP